MKRAIEKHFDEMIELMKAIAVKIEKKPVSLFQGIESACRLLKEVLGEKKKVFFIGNGGSAGIASHMAVDFWKNGGIKATAFNDSSLLTCLSNDYGYEHVFAKPIKVFAENGDLLIAISSSGNSPNILNGVKAAREVGLKVVTLSGFSPDNKLLSQGDINFFVPSSEYGPVEVLHQFICHYILDIFITERGTL